MRRILLFRPPGVKANQSLRRNSEQAFATYGALQIPEKTQMRFARAAGMLPKYPRSMPRRQRPQRMTKKTDFVPAGAEAGSKLAKVQEPGVRILDEAQFRKMLQ